MFLTRIYYAMLYFVVLIYELIKSTIDVSIRASTDGKIDPAIIEIETILERPVSQTILVNSITITPGTVVIDLNPDKKIIKLAIIAPRDKKDINPFEPYIKKMLE